MADRPNDLSPELIERVNQVRSKFDEIHQDLAIHVTKIYDRPELMISIDLVFHSVLSFNFLGNMVRKGWLECLILGDTGCGKTSTVASLIKHYKAGDICTGEGATFAGIVGGAQQFAGNWSITWGQAPLMDRRLLAIDEVSGLTTEMISNMSGMRSDGIAALTKIHQEKTFARTRLIWISNPRGRNKGLRAYNTGIEAVQELIGRPEDVRRFDFAVTVASGEVATKVFNRRVDSKGIPHRYTSQLCHEQVMWAWSRKSEQITITPEAEELILNRSEKMSKQFHASVPLVEPADQRIKLARLAVAAAARLFSTDETGERVIVGPEHVEFIYQFLLQIYTKKSLAYDLYSRQKFAEETILHPDAMMELVTGHGEHFVDSLLDARSLNVSDIELICGTEKTETKDLVGALIKNRCLKRGRFGFFKTPAFIELLKLAKEKDEWPTSEDENETPF